MMKKILLCLLVCTAVFILCACEPKEAADCTDDPLGNQEASAVGKIDWDQEVTDETFFDTEMTHLPTLADFRKLEVGMTLEETIEIIGRPHLPRTTGLVTFGWMTAEGETIRLAFYGDLTEEDIAAGPYARYRYFKTHFVVEFWETDYGIYPEKPWKDNTPVAATSNYHVLAALAEAYFRKSLVWNASKCDNYEAYACFYDTEDEVYIISFAPIDSSVSEGDIYHVAIRNGDGACLDVWKDGEEATDGTSGPTTEEKVDAAVKGGDEEAMQADGSSALVPELPPQSNSYPDHEMNEGVMSEPTLEIPETEPEEEKNMNTDEWLADTDETAPVWETFEKVITGDEFLDKERLHLPSAEDMAKVEGEIRVSELIELVGKPHKLVMNGGNIFLVWYCEDGVARCVQIDLDDEFYMKKYPSLEFGLVKKDIYNQFVEYGFAITRVLPVDMFYPALQVD